MAILLKFHFCNEVPRTFQSLTDTPLDCTTHPGKKWTLAMRTLDIGAARLRPIPAHRRRSRWGGGGARPRAHLGPGGDRSLGGGVASVGARRGQVAAAAGWWCCRREGAHPGQGVVRLGPRDDGETPREFTRHWRGVERRVRRRWP
jgi:hypothetical protein